MPLRDTKMDRAIGGAVITYEINGEQRRAVAAGFTTILWPTKVVTGKIVILELKSDSTAT